MNKADFHGFDRSLSVDEIKLLPFDAKVNYFFRILPEEFKTKDFVCSRYMARKITRHLIEKSLVEVRKGRDSKGRFTGTSYLKKPSLQDYTASPIPMDEALSFVSNTVSYCSVHSVLRSVHSDEGSTVDVESGCVTSGIFGGEGKGEGVPPLILNNISGSHEGREEAVEEKPPYRDWNGNPTWEYEDSLEQEEDEKKERDRKYRENIEAKVRELAKKPKEYQRPNRMEFEKTIDYMRKEDGLELNYNIPKERASWKRLVTKYGETEAMALIYELRTVRLMDEWWFTNIDLVPSSLTPRVIELIKERMDRLNGKRTYTETEGTKP
jgi:hypothetical protein